MQPACIQLPRLLLPADRATLSHWAVIACDQFTAEPSYWAQTEALVGTDSSCLRLTLPEVYLSADDTPRITAIHQTMDTYLSAGLLRELDDGLMLIERDCGRGSPRRGVLLAFDLDAYDERPGAQTPIRPTEATVTERVPARLAIRAQAPFELPHILLFVDDPAHTLLEPLFSACADVPVCYDFTLMQGGGHIKSRFVPIGDAVDAFLTRLSAHAAPEACRARYGLSENQAPLVFATGDGNHSMAAAKAHWEQVKRGLNAEQALTHPARFVLAELVNLQDESICFEAVHRLLLNVHADDALAFLCAYFSSAGLSCSLDGHAEPKALLLPFYTQGRSGALSISGAEDTLPVALLQEAIDAFLRARPEVQIDFIHGTDTLLALSDAPARLGFLLPDFGKDLLFPYVLNHGVLPRKTFSMGTALEKRYYLEGRMIR